MQKASPGRTVMVIGGPARSNGTDTAPAVITRVWGIGYPGNGVACPMVNATVLPDNSHQTRAVTSISLYADEKTARDNLGDDLDAAVAHWPTMV